MELKLHGAGQAESETVTLDNENIRELMQNNAGTEYYPYDSVISIKKTTTRTEEDVKNDFCMDIPALEVADCNKEGE